MSAKKKSSFMTVAKFLVAGLAFANPVTKASEAVQIEQTRTADANKDAVVRKDEKGQGISTNHMSGGLDFDMPRMISAPNPIYIPRYHTKMTYRTQSKNALKRRKAK